MKKLILATMLLLGVANYANAQEKNYVGVNAGTVTSDAQTPVNTYGVRLGREFTKNLLGEIDYTHVRAGNGNDSGHALFANAIAQYRVPGTVFTPYALAGVGYGWDRFGDQSLFNLGLGVKAEVSRSTDFDLRFRQIRSVDQWDSKDRYDNTLTAGLTFKF